MVLVCWYDNVYWSGIYLLQELFQHAMNCFFCYKIERNDNNEVKMFAIDNQSYYFCLVVPSLPTLL